MQRHSREPFRDELGGALARIEQLELENEQLRHQLQTHAAHGPEGGEAHPGLHHRPSRATVLLPLVAAWGLIMTAALVRSTSTEERFPTATDVYVGYGSMQRPDIPRAVERPCGRRHRRAACTSSTIPVSEPRARYSS